MTNSPQKVAHLLIRLDSSGRMRNFLRRIGHFWNLLTHKINLKKEKSHFLDFLELLCPLGDLLGGITFAGADFAEGGAE